MSYKRSNAVEAPRKKRPMGEPKYVVVGGEVKKVTEKAVLLIQNIGGTVNAETWIPRSTILNGAQVTVGEETLSIAEWFAVKEALNYAGKKVGDVKV